jgi:hypothetical protein
MQGNVRSGALPPTIMMRSFAKEPWLADSVFDKDVNQRT